MRIAADVAIVVVAVIHVALAIVEGFVWQQPWLNRWFNCSESEARKFAPIVANLGMHNVFLAVGLVWAMLTGGYENGAVVFFLKCIVIAGIFGALTLKPVTIALQTLPATIALVLVSLVNMSGA